MKILHFTQRLVEMLLILGGYKAIWLQVYMKGEELG